MDLAENLHAMRKKIGMSQEELAEKCNVSRQAIAKWEYGESIPTLEKLLFLADLYECTLDELVGRKNKCEYEVFKEYVLEHHADEIPYDEDDNISPIVHRYMLFANELKLDASDILRGLEDIFLKD